MIKVHKTVYEKMAESFTSHAPECGGVLGSTTDGSISEFYFDISGVSTAESYTPDHVKINEVLENDWALRGVKMVGIVHSHGNSGDFPSCGDIYYCGQIMENAGIGEFLLPIVTVSPFNVHFYKVLYNGETISLSKENFTVI